MSRYLDTYTVCLVDGKFLARLGTGPFLPIVRAVWQPRERANECGE